MFILSIKQNKTYIDNTVILHVIRYQLFIHTKNMSTIQIKNRNNKYRKNKAEWDISFVFFLFIFSSIEKMLKYDA